jgi:serine/threonine-protein kinase
VAPHPSQRFPSAEAADLFKEGAAAFHRQLVMGNMASEYGNELRMWLEELKSLEDEGQNLSEPTA